MTADRRAAAEQALRAEASVCQRCPQLAAARTQVVFGSGSVDAQVMFVGEAPGANEDREGVPFVGASGRLLDQLLGGIGIEREQVYITNVLKCRPPDNRDPRSEEIANCSGYLERQVELVEPIVVVTLGNFATKLLRGSDEAITAIHGQAEECTIGSRTVRLLPVFHPAAALYRRPNLELLRDDFARLAELVALGPPRQRDEAGAVAPASQPAKPPTAQPADDDAPQLDLF